MLDEEQRLPRDLDEARDRAAHADAHLGVEIGRGLVEEIEVCGNAEAQRDGDALRLAAREGLERRLHQRADLERRDHILNEARLANRVAEPELEQISHTAGGRLVGRQTLRLAAHTQRPSWSRAVHTAIHTAIHSAIHSAIDNAATVAAAASAHAPALLLEHLE